MTVPWDSRWAVAGTDTAQRLRPALHLLGGLDDPEDGADRVLEDRDPADVRDVHRLEDRRAAELLRLRDRGVDVLDGNVRLPERRHRRIGHLHQPADVGLAVLED